jgi:hypothetical protein
MAFGTLSVDRITSSDYTLIDNYIADSGRPLSNRNLIINGAMQIAQRNTSVTGITSADYYTVDRWKSEPSSAGTWTMNVESSGPTNTEFRKSANVICTTADSSLSASDYFVFSQRIEGQNLQGIKKGTSEAESLTVSFWVKSGNTGTYICEFYDNDNTRQISKSYTIDAADTWEKKTLTVPSDTTGQLDDNNATSFILYFWLAAGTDFTSGALNDTAWASSTNTNRAVGQLNLANATGNYWAVTGVQLETGTVATPYEMRSYGQELALCQRYFIAYTNTFLGGVNNRIATGSGSSSTGVRFMFPFPTSMRAAPSVTMSGTPRAEAGSAVSITSASAAGMNAYSAGVDANAASGLTAGSAYAMDTGSGGYSFSAEL